MDSRVTFKEIIVMCLVITSFTVTGIMIINENYKIALISLCINSLCVLIMFLMIASAEEDRILDMTNPNLKNPARKRSNSKKKVSGSIDFSVNKNEKTAGALGKSGNGKRRKNGAQINKNSYENSYKMQDMDGDFYESVGNMRVYKRGEKIELHNDEEDENFE